MAEFAIFLFTFHISLKSAKPMSFPPSLNKSTGIKKCYCWKTFENFPCIALTKQLQTTFQLTWETGWPPSITVLFIHNGFIEEVQTADDNYGVWPWKKQKRGCYIVWHLFGWPFKTQRDWMFGWFFLVPTGIEQKFLSLWRHVLVLREAELNSHVPFRNIKQNPN